METDLLSSAPFAMSSNLCVWIASHSITKRLEIDLPSIAPLLYAVELSIPIPNIPKVLYTSVLYIYLPCQFLKS